jgi:hypothetical protein
LLRYDTAVFFKLAWPMHGQAVKSGGAGKELVRASFIGMIVTVRMPASELKARNVELPWKVKERCMKASCQICKSLSR